MNLRTKHSLQSSSDGLTGALFVSCLLLFATVSILVRQLHGWVALMVLEHT